MRGATEVYIRLVAIRRDAGSGRKQGVIHAAYDLVDAGEVSDGEAEQLREDFAWFNRHLKVPDTSDARVIFWFKGSAHRMIRRIFGTAQVLRANGMPIEVLKTDRPGYLVYEDEEQVGAVPFRETPG